MLEEPHFGGDALASAVAGDALIRSKHSVAGHDDRDRVCADCTADSSSSGRSPRGPANIRIGHGGAERQLIELVPHEGAAGAREVLGQLLRSSIENGAGSLGLVIVGEGAAILNCETREVLAVARELDSADR